MTDMIQSVFATRVVRTEIKLGALASMFRKMVSAPEGADVTVDYDEYEGTIVVSWCEERNEILPPRRLPPEETDG